nr:alcohol acetyltransferase [Tanacetum cinerariifolium]
MFAGVHKLPEGEYAVVLRLHTAVCDRAAAAFLLRELLGLFGGDGKEIVKEERLGLSIEECVPAGKANKPFWARGADMLGYSVNSFRFSNLEFKESGFPKATEFVRMRIGVDDTARILEYSRDRFSTIPGHHKMSSQNVQPMSFESGSLPRSLSHLITTPP